MTRASPLEQSLHTRFKSVGFYRKIIGQMDRSKTHSLFNVSDVDLSSPGAAPPPRVSFPRLIPVFLFELPCMFFTLSSRKVFVVFRPLRRLKPTGQGSGSRYLIGW